MLMGDELLYSVFERNLFVSATSEGEDVNEFVFRVVCDYLTILAQQGVTVPPQMRKTLEDDLKEEVIEMTRKKIYGYSSISEYRSNNSELIEQYYKKHA